MRPAIDSQGNIWFGEMSGNRLGRLNPQNGQVDEWTPPQAEYGIMGIVVDGEDYVWFAEQNAGSIGEFIPTTQTFHVYSTTPRSTDGGLSGPNDLLFDQHGMLWFTEMSAHRVGRLTVANGDLKEYPLPDDSSGTSSAPYGLAFDQQGDVWVGEIGTGRLVKLDPQTGATTSYNLPDARGGIMEVVSAPDGSIWFAEYARGVLGRIEPGTGAIEEFTVPTIVSGGAASGIYGLAIDTAGVLWFTDLGENAIGEFQPAVGRFTLYPLPTPECDPFGITIDPLNHPWFTEGSDAGNALGLITPSSS
jgi:virginiamycin B lyase